ncbi:chromate transporter [Hutsoniella sourekii]|uniref:chromate transporter n=1 Tax=Hutsoniella sourekii TaxID=87650 RepID=UPI000489D53B|nr:chromate transporter [Hutsoniella sourekii]
MIYWQLFLAFLKVGAFSFGGGYAAIPFIQSEVVEAQGWLTLSQFNDLITISQMTPGPIAINAATFVGIRVAGIWGAIVATLGSILPSVILVSILAYFYMRYRRLDLLQFILLALRPIIVALIATAGISLLQTALLPSKAITLSAIPLTLVVIFCVSLFLLRKTQLNTIVVMVLAGVINLLFHSL